MTDSTTPPPDLSPSRRLNRRPPSLAIPRLARYLAFLQHLDPDVRFVSSERISAELGIKATQVRQDFHYFGQFGRAGRGYNRDLLITSLEEILGIHELQAMIIIGLGHLGTALANYRYFNRMNLRLIGLFDNSPKLIGLRFGGIEVMPPSAIKAFARQHQVRIAIVTVPPEAASVTGQLLIEAGIPGIWNFTPVQLNAPSGFIVRNEQPTLGLLALTFQLKERSDESHKNHQPRKAYSFD
ncbi:MAG: redox-sensing transcriptional repressor Rex [Calditrichaeota bacterium]|nr:redox-sensing transcriptional repressor Rex [Calditrichota bacterium]